MSLHTFRIKHSWALILLTVCLVSFSLLLPAHILYSNCKKEMLEEISKRALSVAKTTATLLAMDSLPYIELTKEIQENPKTIDRELYESMHSLFIKLRKDANVDYLYTLYTNDYSSYICILDSQEEKGSIVSFSPVGAQKDMLSSGCDAVFQNAKALSTGISEHERWGTSIFAHAPIIHKGTVIGIVSAGFNIATLEISMQNTFFLILSLFILISTLVSLVICIVLWLRERSMKVEYLTQLGTKQFFESQLTRVSDRAKASKTPFSLLLLDIDGFKQINDTYGHLIGDTVLQIVAFIIRSHVQIPDICSRIGGDEFAVILTSSPLEQALLTAQIIQSTIGDYSLEEHPDLELSISIGVAQWSKGQSTRELIEQADQALYKAKKLGKNTVAD